MSTVLCARVARLRVLLWLLVWCAHLVSCLTVGSVGACLSRECVIWGVWLIVAGFHVGVRGKAAGRLVRCGAKPGGCRLMGADGEPVPHFASLSEGEAFLAEQEAAQRGGFTAGAGDGEAKTAALTECGDGSGLAVDAAGRWYRDGALVENMVEAVSDEGEPVMFTDGEFHGSIVSDAETDVRIHAGQIDDLVNVGCYSNYDDGMNMSMIGGDATVERAFGVSVGYVGDDAHVGLLTDHREPGDTSSFATMSQVDDMRDRAVIDTVDGDTRIFGMMDESRIGVLTWRIVWTLRPLRRGGERLTVALRMSALRLGEVLARVRLLRYCVAGEGRMCLSVL